MKYKFLPLRSHHEWEWISERANPAYCEDSKGIVAYRGEEIVAAVSMDNWSYNSVTIHIAVEDPYVFRHGFADEVFHYIFHTAGKGVVIGITPADNERALKFNKHIGLVELYRIRDGYDVGVDYVVQEIRRENCRYGQKVHSAAA